MISSIPRYPGAVGRKFSNIFTVITREILVVVDNTRYCSSHSDHGIIKTNDKFPQSEYFITTNLASPPCMRAHNYGGILKLIFDILKKISNIV